MSTATSTDSKPRTCTTACNCGRRVLIGAVVLLVGVLVATVVIVVQAASLQSDWDARLARESAAPLKLVTQVADVPAARRWADAQQQLVTRNGVIAWPTSQPAIERIATSKVAGVNPKKVAAGLRVYQSLCVQCHTADGRAGVGPSLYNSLGSQIELADGTKITVDDAYLTESIRQPLAKIHKGYPPAMPDFGPVLKDRDVENLKEFIKSISPEPKSRQLLGPVAAPPAQ